MTPNTPWIITAIISLVSVIFGAGGFWAYLQSRNKQRSLETKILLGLGHDRIIYLATKYLDRGDWITHDEYENLYNYLYDPYHSAGGNGVAERAMSEVKQRLRIVRVPPPDYRDPYNPPCNLS